MLKLASSWFGFCFFFAWLIISFVTISNIPDQKVCLQLIIVAEGMKHLNHNYQ